MESETQIITKFSVIWFSPFCFRPGFMSAFIIVMLTITMIKALMKPGRNKKHYIVMLNIIVMLNNFESCTLDSMLLGFNILYSWFSKISSLFE
jgi:hypothetical protein